MCKFTVSDFFYDFLGNCLRFANPAEATGGLEAGGSVTQVSWKCFGEVLEALGRVPGGSPGMLDVSWKGHGTVKVIKQYSELNILD